ncbi:class I SAM-dependent methyltransferase [Nonomuraea diastatica]|uniref:class I SAM-dependent methyltransferase n=1 Tax=Nonomuraea diastatica TaxID=1848329 RepID=UPI001C70A843|nr:class I SAM-dependent methyltransferase [Nonomuraea diastatica]
MRADDQITDRKLEKADFNDIYDRPDPRAYFDRLGSLDYAVPHHGQRVFLKVLDALDVDSPTVVDLCCSYGVNAALMKCDLTLDHLYDHYADDQVAHLAPEQLADEDRSFYRSHRRRAAPRVIGLDTASSAVEYAVNVGLLDAGASDNLEQNDPSPELAKIVGEADLITVTGGIGYITDRSIDRLLDCTSPDRRPWFAALCLRTVDFTPVADTLARHGLITEQLDNATFPQRRFADDLERKFALRSLAEQGLDPTGKEADGEYHVNVFLSRPSEDVAVAPIDALLDDLAPPDSPSAMNHLPG